MFIGQLPPGTTRDEVWEALPGTTRDEVWEALLTFGAVHTECGHPKGKKLVPSTPYI